MSTKVDSHQHFWIYDPVEYAWMNDEMAVLRETHLPEHLAPHLDAAGIDSSVVVQVRQTLEETRWMCELAATHERVAGVVGWVDLRADDVSAQLDAVQSPWLVGIRHIVQDEPDDAFMLDPEFQRGIAALAAHRLVYDVLVYPKQLDAAITLARAFPDQPFVVDHIAKPLVKAGVCDPWADQMRALATCRNVTCKVSGLITEAGWDTWSPADFAPYLDVVLEAFGPERLLYGSDWPVCNLAGTYARVFDLATSFAARLSHSEREAFFGGTATRFYGLA
ncbi:MAG: amidohydrolase [Planctomycetes bacterium]|nr:amidohydrolase [Planctomycetota bacterium]